MNILFVHCAMFGEQRNYATLWRVQVTNSLVYSRVLVAGRYSLQDTIQDCALILQVLWLNKLEISGSLRANSAPLSLHFVSDDTQNTQNNLKMLTLI